MNILEVKNLSHTYSDTAETLHVLKGINAKFEESKLYAIKGESGSGKTTLLSLIAGLDNVQEGDITFNGTSIKKIGLGEFRLKYANIVFQQYNLIKYMTAAENVQVAIDFAGRRGDDPVKFLKKVDLDKDEAKRLVNQLSGGQQQRVAIARALASNVPIITADEPTGNLDEDTEDKIIEELKKLAKKQNKIVIVVTHSKRVAKHADVVYTLERGHLK